MIPSLPRYYLTLWYCILVAYLEAVVWLTQH